MTAGTAAAAHATTVVVRDHAGLALACPVLLHLRMSKKLVLKSETLRTLTDDTLAAVHGGIVSSDNCRVPNTGLLGGCIQSCFCPTKTRETTTLAKPPVA